MVLLRDPTRSHVRTLGRSLVRVRPACLGGVLPCLLPALAQGDLVVHLVFFTSRVASAPHAPTESRQDPTIPRLPSSQYLPSRIEFSSCVICPPSLRRLRLSSNWRVKPKVCSTRHVHQGSCVVHVACFLAETLAVLRIQTSSTFASFHPSGNVWTVREEACSFCVPSASCVTLHVEGIHHV